jgi:hypothetical protein
MPYKLLFLDWLRWEFTERGGWDRQDAADPVIRFARYVLFDNESLGNSLRNVDSGEPQDIANQLKRRKVPEEKLVAFARTWREFVTFKVELDRGIARYRRQYARGQSRVHAA